MAHFMRMRLMRPFGGESTAPVTDAQLLIFCPV